MHDASSAGRYLVVGWIVLLGGGLVVLVAVKLHTSRLVKAEASRLLPIAQCMQQLSRSVPGGGLELCLGGGAGELRWW